MLRGTTTRRCAAVLMVALVAVLLVATGGSARTAHTRASVGSGHTAAAPTAGRHAALVAPVAEHHAAPHLDLAATAPDDAPATPPAVVGTVDAPSDTWTASDTVAATGRGPPAA